MRDILRNKDMNLEFSKKGFVTIPLLGRAEAEELRSLVSGLNEQCKLGKANVESSYSLSFFAADPETKRKVFKELTSFLMPRVNAFVDGYLPLISNIFDKEPGTGEVPMHQNWTFVDEDRYDSITIYIPLLDVSRHNGAIEVVPRSHRGVTKYRGPSIPWVFQNFVPELKTKYCEPVNLKFGEAAIIYDSIVHYSSVNKADTSRLACQVILYPREAQPILYHWDEQNPGQLEVFAVDSEFFTRYKQPHRPERVPCLGTIPFRLEMLEESEFVDRVIRNHPDH